MRTKLVAILSVAVSLLMSVSCNKEKNPAQEPEPYVPTGCQQRKDMPFKSNVLGKNLYYNAILPATWDENDTQKTYPIIYLLHGAGDNTEYSKWMGQTNLLKKLFAANKAGTIEDCIIVTPQAWNCFYLNASRGLISWLPDKLEYEKFFFEEFMPAIEKQYHATGTKETRAIAGLSMGGFGTFSYALLHPEMFCYAYSMSMPFWGGENPEDRINENIIEMADPEKTPFIMIVGGTTDFTVGSGPANSYKALVAAGFKTDYEEWSGGHDWNFWDQCIDKFLPAIGSEFKKRNEPAN